MRTLRIFLTSLIVGWFGGCFSTLPWPDAGAVDEVPPEVALEVLEQEVAAAKALGFEELSRGEEAGWRRGFWMKELPLEQGCVAFVVALSGPRVDTSVRLQREGELPDLARSTTGLNVAHVQACDDTNPVVNVRLETSTGARALAPPSTLHWVALVGRRDAIGGNEKLSRGYVPKEPSLPE